MQAIEAFRRSKLTYRILYRIKYLQRIAKMVKDGWNITNLDIKFTTSAANNNGETVCAISHEELLDGSMIVQLGTRTTVDPRQRLMGRSSVLSGHWTQTSVLTWEALMQYLFAPLPRVEEVFAGRSTWAIVCPISKSEVDITEHRPIGVLFKEACLALQSKLQSNLFPVLQ